MSRFEHLLQLELLKIIKMWTTDHNNRSYGLFILVNLFFIIMIYSISLSIKTLDIMLLLLLFQNGQILFFKPENRQTADVTKV